MRLLRLAVEKQRWDLAAHTIVLATVRVLDKGGKPNAVQGRQKKGHLSGQTKGK